jgi:hypothetical protein
MEFIKGLQASMGDAFLTLPLLLLGFTFFFGTLTSNTGLLYLFLGHLLVVPALSFLANEPGAAWSGGPGPADTFFKLIKWVLSTLIFFGLHGDALGGGGAFGIFALLLIPLIGQYIVGEPGKEVPAFFFLNPVAWFMPKPATQETAGPACSVIPNADPSDPFYTTPSTWLTHLVFFFGFIFSNAAGIYNTPAPKLPGLAANERERKNREARLEARVRNRKLIAGSIIAMSTVLLLLLLLFRYKKTPCEGGFFYSLFPLLAIGLTGASWFTVVYTKCGVRPVDVLGLVQGMISPDLIDNPVVCMGSEN